MDPTGEPHLQEAPTVNTGRTSLLSFLLFFVALFAAFPLIQVSPAAALAAGAVSALSFSYAMYLWIWAMRKGDPRLVRRGKSGTAEIVESKQTSWQMAAGEYYGIGAPSVWKYKLEVTLPDHGPYKTVLYICAHLHKGAPIPVKVSRWNHKRVTVDGPALAEQGGGINRSTRREEAIKEFLADRGQS
jgi:hypothetical protein